MVALLLALAVGAGCGGADLEESGWTLRASEAWDAYADGFADGWRRACEDVIETYADEWLDLPRALWPSCDPGATVDDDLDPPLQPPKHPYQAGYRRGFSVGCFYGLEAVDHEGDDCPLS